jgi:redox-regulated HSP33 family molecular chaperone
MDGSFTQEILNSGFDWRYTPRPQIAVTLDQTEFHSANRSLRLVYNENGSDAGIFQYIAAQPNTRYRLSAWVRSEDLKTANGPMLAILDGHSNEIYGSTEETTGTTAWHRVETELQTGPQTELLILTVLRHPGETRIQGEFWVDDIELWPETQPKGNAPPGYKGAAGGSLNARNTHG